MYVRSIPAHAGQSASGTSRAPRCWVHPRSRGAVALVGLLDSIETGPSPLTRGSHALPFRRADRPRSIPAHAGQSFRSARHRTPQRVHPRSRGAVFSSAVALRASTGPSPLTRGSRGERYPGPRIHGSIPAHAGQSNLPEETLTHAEVHPRSRGAVPTASLSAGWYVGPSPLTRGSRVPTRAAARTQRSIPAHAGQSSALPCLPSTRKVHPRSRGAVTRIETNTHWHYGPSPLTRGSRGHG